MAQGRKPDPGNVVPLHGEATAESEQRRLAAAARTAEALKPADLLAALSAEWDRIAPVLADPALDRLKPQFVDCVLEYCRVVVRLRELRAQFASVSEETYEVSGRNGDQLKTHPVVAQINEAWRQWRSLVGMLGLSPADARALVPGQGDLFEPTDKYF